MFGLLIKAFYHIFGSKSVMTIAEQTFALCEETIALITNLVTPLQWYILYASFFEQQLFEIFFISNDGEGTIICWASNQEGQCISARFFEFLQNNWCRTNTKLQASLAFLSSRKLSFQTKNTIVSRIPSIGRGRCTLTTTKELLHSNKT